MSSAKPQVQLPRYHSIDSLRAVTMLLVLVFHAAIIYLPFDTDRVLYQDEMRSSFTGWVVLFTRLFHMPVFFMVSGFFRRLFVRYPGRDGFPAPSPEADRTSPCLQLSGAVSTYGRWRSLYQIPDGRRPAGRRARTLVFCSNVGNRSVASLVFVSTADFVYRRRGHYAVNPLCARGDTRPPARPLPRHG